MEAGWPASLITFWWENLSFILYKTLVLRPPCIDNDGQHQSYRTKFRYLKKRMPRVSGAKDKNLRTQRKKTEAEKAKTKERKEKERQRWEQNGRDRFVASFSAADESGELDGQEEPVYHEKDVLKTSMGQLTLGESMQCSMTTLTPHNLQHNRPQRHWRWS